MAVVLAIREIKRYLVNFRPFGYILSMSNLRERIIKLEDQIAELKARWPAHSAQPWMLQQLEDLEEELEALQGQEQADE